MAWIEEIQRSLGGPVLAFAQQNWIFLLIAGAVAVMWLFGSLSDRDEGWAFLWFGSGDNDADDGDGRRGDGGD